MAIRTGIAGQIGFKAETTVGTAVTVDSFVPLVSEGIKRKEKWTESAGIMPSRLVQLSNQWQSGEVDIDGPITLELYTATMRPLLKAMFGTETGAGPYTYTPGDLWGNSLTVQFGRPGMNGTVQPFTYGGVKIKDWTLSCQAGGIAQLQLGTMSCLVDEDTTTALATASISAGIKPMTFTGATISLGGSSINVNNVSLKGDNKLAGRRFLGSRFYAEPVQTENRLYNGTLQAEFESKTIYELYKARTEQALVLTFTNGSNSLAITTNIRLDGETPNIQGRGIIAQPLPFTCTASGGADSSAISAVYT